jgi:outer membrane protein insertion porin family
VKKTILTTIVSTTVVLGTQTFNDIQFDGLTQISKNIALESLEFTKDSVDDKKIDEAIKRFYKFNYFNDIWVTDDNKVLTFHFKEKPFIAKLKMSGYKNREDDQKMLFDAMEIHKGNMYTPKKINKAKKILLLALAQEGYVNSVVEVNVETLSDTSVVVTFDVNKGEPIIIKNIKYIVK